MRRITWHFLAGLLVISGILLATLPGCAGVSGPGALRSAFPETTKVRNIKVPGVSEKIKSVSAAESNGEVLGYAVRETVVSRSGPFTIVVTLNPEAVVQSVDIASYPAQRGAGVRQESFRKQFVGLGPDALVRQDWEVDAATGASLSSQAVARGVRRAIRLVLVELSG